MIGKSILALFLTMYLSGCVTRSKPTYDYSGKVDDPEFVLESDFGIDTSFFVDGSPATSQNFCKNRKSVAFFQEKDSYCRYSSAEGPWTFKAPANQPIVISGGWFKYGMTSFGTFSTTHYSATACAAQSKLMTGEEGKRYRIYLRKDLSNGCSFEISDLDGSPVVTQDVPTCRLK